MISNIRREDQLTLQTCVVCRECGIGWENADVSNSERFPPLLPRLMSGEITM